MMSLFSAFSSQKKREKGADRTDGVECGDGKEEPRVASPERNGIWMEHWSRKSDTERTTERDQGASLLDLRETGHDPNEQAPRNERVGRTRLDADQRSPQVTKHGHGKLRAGKQQQQDGPVQKRSGVSLEPGLNTMREARCRTHLDGDGFGAARTRQHVNFKRAHFRSPASNTTKITREDPEEREDRMKMVAGEGKKSVKFWPPHPSKPQTSGPHPSAVGRRRLHTNTDFLIVKPLCFLLMKPFWDESVSG